MHFPVHPAGPIKIQVKALGGDEFTLFVGGVSQLGGDAEDVCPALTVRHLRVLARLFTGNFADSPEIPINYSDLLGRHDGGRERRQLRRTLSELGRTWMHVLGKDPAKFEARQLLQYNPEVTLHPGVDRDDPSAREDEGNICCRQLRMVKLDEYFWRVLLNWENCWKVRADVIGAIRTDLEVACYLALGQRAHHKGINEDTPGRKDAADLLREANVPVPKYPSQIAQIFERARGEARSLLESLNGLPTAAGYLRVGEQLERNKAGTGFNVLYWMQYNLEEGKESATRVAGGVLLEIWRSCGLPSEAFWSEAKSEYGRLAYYEIEKIEALPYPVEGNRRYLEMVRSFIGPSEFAMVIGEAERKKREGDRIEDMGRYFGGALKSAFREFAIRKAKAAHAHR
jgi:hypothetical protein